MADSELREAREVFEEMLRIVRFGSSGASAARVA